MLGNITINGFRVYVKRMSDGIRAAFYGNNDTDTVKRVLEIAPSDVKAKTGQITSFRRAFSLKTNYTTSTLAGNSPFSTVNVTAVRSNHPEATTAELDAQLQQAAVYFGDAANRASFIAGEL